MKNCLQHQHSALKCSMEILVGDGNQTNKVGISQLLICWNCYDLMYIGFDDKIYFTFLSLVKLTHGHVSGFMIRLVSEHLIHCLDYVTENQTSDDYISDPDLKLLSWVCGACLSILQ